MSKKILVVLMGMIVLALFGMATLSYNLMTAGTPDTSATTPQDTLVRPHSPVFGPEKASVTIVEFFDPSCEACRAFYPMVKQILASFPKDTRLVLRYTAFHQGSEEVIRLLEAARLQGKYVALLELLLAEQPRWANHDAPDLDLAFKLAETTGLDMAKVQRDMASPGINRVVAVDASDVAANNVRQTPTFFVNGRPLPKFGPQELYALVGEEVEKAKAR